MDHTHLKLIFILSSFGENWSVCIRNRSASDLHHTYSDLHESLCLQILTLKGTNGRQKTYEIFHVYCIFYSGFMCQTTVICGITKDGSLESNILASWNCFTCRNLFQNGANNMSECLTFGTTFCKKAQNFV